MLILHCYSEATVTWQKRKLELKGSGTTTNELSNTFKRQVLLKQMVRDPTGKQGPRMIKEGIARDEGLQIMQYKSTNLTRLEPF